MNIKEQKKILFLVSEDRYFCSHRLNLAKYAIENGFTVAVATRISHHAETIKNANIRLFPLTHFTRAGINPYRQYEALKELYRIYKIYQPDIVHSVAIKPIVFGTLIGLLCKTPKIINALGGLGYLFNPFKNQKNPLKNIKKHILRYFICKVFSFIFSRKNGYLILQNEDDLKTLAQYHCIKNREKIAIIRGAGVDMKAYPETPYPPEPPIIITCIARLLWDKGIGELVDAAKELHQKKLPVNIILYGMNDPINPASIPTEQIEAWHREGIIEWRGHCQNVAKAYQECHIAVLPSYREGLPKSLLEAASSARPIVTTDVPGCKEVVLENVNGLLVPAQNSHALANALVTLIENKALRIAMGKKGRERIQNYFSDAVINQKIIALYQN